MSNGIPEGKIQLSKALLAGGIMTREIVQQELARSGKETTKMGKALLACGFPSEDDLISVIARNIRIPNVRVQNLSVAPEVVKEIPREVASEHQLLALERIGDILVVVTPHIGKPEAFAAVRQATGCFMAPIRCAEEGFQSALEKFYGPQKKEKPAPQPAAAAVAEMDDPFPLPPPKGAAADPANPFASSSSAPVTTKAPDKAPAKPVKQAPAKASASPNPFTPAAVETKPPSPPPAPKEPPFDPDAFEPIPTSDQELAGSIPLAGGVHYNYRSIWEHHFTQAGPIPVEAVE